MQKNNFDIKSLMTFIESQYRLDKETIIDIIELSILKSASKNKMFSTDLHVEVDRSDYSVHVFDKFVVDDELKGPGIISTKTAKKYTNRKDIKEEDIIEIEIPIESLGRICARESRMMILQKIKQAKNKSILDDYKNKIGHIVSGIVTGYDKGNIIFTVNGNVDMIIPKNEKIYSEKYKMGDKISGIILRVNEKQKYSPIIVSRSNESFIDELMRNEIPEINDGKIKIVKIVRIPGNKSKVLIKTDDTKIDPVGVCVGKNGIRIKNIMSEFQHEKIDIIKYSDNVFDIIKESLLPIRVNDIKQDPLDPTNIIIYTNNDDYEKLTKRYNKNISLTSRLVGQKITIEKFVNLLSFEEIKDKAVEMLSELLDIPLTKSLIIVDSGYTSIECIADEELKTFIENCGLDEISASGIHAAAKAIVEHLKY